MSGPRTYKLGTSSKINPDWLYKTWSGMKERCDRPNHKAYKRYGGRGITYSDEWKSFDKFIEDMGRPEKGMTLDRINNDGNYSKENCRWATRKEQSRNTSFNRNLTWLGITRPVARWSELLEVPAKRLYERLRKGWSVEKTLTTGRTINQYTKPLEE